MSSGDGVRRSEKAEGKGEEDEEEGDGVTGVEKAFE